MLANFVERNKHVLKHCPQALSMCHFNERHDAVLEIIASFITQHLPDSYKAMAALSRYIPFPLHIATTDKDPAIICMEWYNARDQGHWREEGRKGRRKESRVTDDWWRNLSMDFGASPWFYCVWFPLYTIVYHQWHKYISTENTVTKKKNTYLHHDSWQLPNNHDRTPVRNYDPQSSIREQGVVTYRSRAEAFATGSESRDQSPFGGRSRDQDDSKLLKINHHQGTRATTIWPLTLGNQATKSLRRVRASD